MLRDLLARLALGMLGTAIAVSCTGEDKARDENLGSVQLALAGSAAGGIDAGGAPAVGNPVGGAGGEGGQPEPACDPVACGMLGECMHCNPDNNQCEPYDAQDDQPCGTIKGTCDVADFCAGGPSCPDEVEDGGTVCRSSQGACDFVEECDGVDPECPDDTFLGSNVTCRPSTGDCDVADTCDSSGPDCPNDDKQPDGSSCGDNVNRCLLVPTCEDGECVIGAIKDCPNDTDCKEDVCNPLNGQCRLVNRPAGTDCDDGIVCTENDECNTSGSCGHGTPNDDLCPSPQLCGTYVCDPNADPGDFPDHCRMDPEPQTEQCRPAGGPCGVAEFCDGTNAECPASNPYRPSTASCGPAAACVNFSATPASFCTGDSVSCPAAVPTSCAGYACEGAVCRSDCTGDQHCDPGHYCLNGTCEARIGAGEPCDNDSQCSAGAAHCVDGVCCDTVCDDQCEACDVEGAEGTCSPVTGAPHGDRQACAGDGSPCNGVCDGQVRSECDFPSAQTVCRDAACDASTGVAVEQAFCDGVGSCATTDAIECAPFICGPTACRGDCATDAQCTSGAFCRAGKCTPAQDAGERCTRDSQCESGFCTDGVCCEARCDGQCESCGAGGKCNAVSGAPVGTRQACAGEDACAGECDGQNRLACSYPGAAVVCRAASCSDGEATVAAQCNGGGSCAAAESVTCPNGCEGAICAGDDCVVSSDCEAGERCVAGTCAPAGEPGNACSTAADCSTGFCVDGVCCDSACDGQCEACDSPSRVGTCSAIEGAPHGARPPCTSDGSACGGTCDGEDPNGCTYPDGTVCAPGQCTPGQGGAEAVATVESQCNGSGRCPAPRQQACGGAGCDAAEQVCDGDCADGSACPSGEYCSAGICVSTEPNGTACQTDRQCASGYCVDGYCCGSACDDRCAACDVPGELGKCTPVTGNTHGGRPGCPGGGACGAQCDGQNVSSCSFPDEDVSCGEPYCHDGSQVGASLCDGAGQCRAGEQTACAAFACDGDQCSDACETDADCTRSLQCREGVCVEPFLINAVDEGTCGCRAPGSHPERSGAALALAGLVLLGLRRRRAVKAA